MTSTRYLTLLRKRRAAYGLTPDQFKALLEYMTGHKSIDAMTDHDAQMVLNEMSAAGETELKARIAAHRSQKELPL